MNRMRYPLFDVAKAIAIFLVVYSHVMFCRPGFDLRTMPSYAMNFIWVINMPFFFMISGYFSRNLHESGDWKKFANRLIRYFWPLAVFGVVFAVVESVCCGKYPWTNIPLWALKKFLFCGWFFYALAGCELITFLLYKWSERLDVRIWICCCSFVVCLLGSGRIWHAKNIVAMIPFYWFGLWALPFILEARNRYWWRLIAFVGGILLILTTFCCGSIATNGLSFYLNHYDIFNPTMHDFLLMLARYSLGVFGCCFLLLILSGSLLVPPGLDKIAGIGTETLGIFFIQGYVITYGSNKLVSLNASQGVLFASSIIVVVLSWLIVKFLNSRKLIKVLIWGPQLKNGSLANENIVYNG